MQYYTFALVLLRHFPVLQIPVTRVGGHNAVQGHSRSFKMTDFSTIGKPFRIRLLASYLASFPSYRAVLVKLSRLTAFDAIIIGNLCECHHVFLKTRLFELHYRPCIQFGSNFNCFDVMPFNIIHDSPILVATESLYATSC